MPEPTPDQEARDRIEADLETTLFVEAGAGSGKTTRLVARLVALVTSGEVELANVAAITFTDKAAAELRDRVRRALTRLVVDRPGTPEADRCELALSQLDSAAIGTLHGFARRILSEHPIEAGLPPRVEVLDEVSSAVGFDQRWSGFQEELLDDPALRRTLLLFFATGVRTEALRVLGLAFEQNWDLVADRVPATAPEPSSPRDLLAPVLERLRVVCGEPCREATDRLRAHLDDVAEFADQLEAIEDELDLVEALGLETEPKPPSFRVGQLGRTQNYADVEAVRAALRDVGDALVAVRASVARACAARLGSAIRAFTLEAADERRRAGRLQFHDLLVLARALLTDPVHGPTVRARLHDRYRRILLDEFQDTDPIQIELAVRIAASDPAGLAAGSAPWQEVEVAPGHLFFVGDPKQSIYRFRRADIGVFLAAEERFGGPGFVALTANFRTLAPAIEWVNHTFGALMGEGSDVELPVASQPDYRALTPSRGGEPVGPAVAVIGRTPHPKEVRADEVRAAEALDVAAAITRIVADGWGVDDGAGGFRPARLGDVTVLIPSRASLPFLEDALEEAGIAFRTEASSLVYGSRAVRDALMVLRAVDDPTNYLHIVSALRTPLLACGDDDLFRFRSERRGRWSYLADQPDTVPNDDPVRLGLAYLRSLYDERNLLAPSELLGRIVEERRVLELGFLEGRPRDLWRRIRFVIDQARAWSEATSGNLREYLAWVARQASEGARVAEAVLPETDDDAVRILTVHAAKGLEFPITVLSGTSTAPVHRAAAAEVVFPPSGGVGYRFGSRVETEEYSDFRPIDEQMGLHERIRLLYVACTRARDHLVVSLHRKARANPPKPHARTNAELLADGMAELLDGVPDAPGADLPLSPLPFEAPPPPPPFPEWAAEREAALSVASFRRTVAATALTDEGAFDAAGEPDPGLEKRPPDLDLPPWLKGRYGTAIGRAVHGVLQSLDLSSGAGLAALVAAQCEAEAVPERSRDVARLVEAARTSPSVAAAATSGHWREVYFCTPLGDRLLEGYVDLLYRTPEGLVVVDYKTSATADPAELDRRVALYANQGASYALGIAATTSEEVVRVVFVFLTPSGAVERELPELTTACERVRALVADGREVLTP